MALSQNCFKESTPDVQNWELLQQSIAIEEAIAALQGFQIPEYDEIDITYYGPPEVPTATNNIKTVVYSNNGSPVSTLTLTYAVQPPTDDDANLVNVTIS
jgi:hypothetical protein